MVMIIYHDYLKLIITFAKSRIAAGLKDRIVIQDSRALNCKLAGSGCNSEYINTLVCCRIRIDPSVNEEVTHF